MNFLSFAYFQALCQADTIRQAAERLYISPQALSEQLTKLEREVGATLFMRTLPLTLTAAGRAFAQCAQTCLEARRRLELQLAAEQERAAGRPGSAGGAHRNAAASAACVLGLFPPDVSGV